MHNQMEEFKFSNRRNFIKKIIFGSLSITFLNSFTFFKKRDKTKKITILHTNDIHSHIDSFPENHSKYGGRGGIRRIASMINRIRSEEKKIKSCRIGHCRTRNYSSKMSE